MPVFVDFRSLKMWELLSLNMYAYYYCMRSSALSELFLFPCSEAKYWLSLAHIESVFCVKTALVLKHTYGWSLDHTYYRDCMFIRRLNWKSRVICSHYLKNICKTDRLALLQGNSLTYLQHKWFLFKKVCLFIFLYFYFIDNAVLVLLMHFFDMSDIYVHSYNTLSFC